MEFIKQILFGVKAEGEPIKIPSLPLERAFNANEFYQWCKEYAVSSQYPKYSSKFNF